MVMSIMADLIGAIQTVIEQDPAYSNVLFTDYGHLEGNHCHGLVINSIKEAARKVPGVTPSEYELELGKEPRWRPDVRLLSAEGQLLGVVEYESLNSSDDRVISKDVYGYEGWVASLENPIPLLIITTLPDASAPDYRLLWTGCNRTEGYSNHNVDHGNQVAEIRGNPFRYWYAYYRRWLEHRIKSLPIFFANFSGNELRLLDSWPVAAAPYEPDFEDGSDWSGLFDTPDVIKELRKTYKRTLWSQTNLAGLKAVLEEYWSKEQAARRRHSGAAWPDKYFRWWCRRLQNREEACRWIEKVQWAKIY
jgi:hypothetical protein